MQWRKRSRANQISMVDAALTAASAPSAVRKEFLGDVEGQVTNLPFGAATK
jgi:hypothetical protein